MSIRLGIFIRRDLYYKITNLRYTTVATGIANMYPVIPPFLLLVLSCHVII